tara:strand:- start:7890 stop:9872 length:1983 start_codon:yes stop_codon:yes gene_type:complete
MKTFIYALLFTFLISCQQNPKMNFSGDLEIGVEQSGSLLQKISKPYEIQLDSNSFILGSVNQKTVDVIVKLVDDENKEVGSFDGPARGLEYFSFNIKKSGTYRLEVEPFEEQSGDYSIIIDKVESIATDRSKRVDQLFSFYSNDQPGAVIGVVEDGEMIFSKAYGKANITHNLDFKLNTPTNIGSVSKQFTAFAILLLEQQGLLSIDDDVRKHIPEFPDFGELITIKNLLNHTNGLREVYNLLPITGWNGEDKLLRSEILNMLKRQEKLQVSPGEEFNYNNSAFILLAEIVERKTDSKFPDWMKKNVFEPLGMKDSYVRLDPSQIIPHASQGYSQGDNGFIESGDLYAAYGAGGIYTTPLDLSKWLQNFKDPKIGGKEVIEKLVTPGILKKGDTLPYALGIGVRNRKGLKMYAHSGADIAHRASLIYYPEINSGVIVMSNNASFSTAVAADISDLFFAKHLKEKEKKTIVSEAKTSDEYNVDIKTLKSYVGKYKASSMGLVIDYKLEDGKLVAYPTGQSSLPLVPTSKATFNYKGITATIVFKMDDDGKNIGATHKQGGQVFQMEKLQAFNPSPNELKAYEGKYFCDELETFYTIVVKDSVMIAIHRNLKDITFSPIENDTFSGDISFMNNVVFKRDTKGKINAFSVSNGRTKGVHFKKQ